MASPPKDRIPSHGASTSTRGVLRGQAQGNHFNQADVAETWEEFDRHGHTTEDAEPGRIQVYITANSPANVDITTVKPMFAVAVRDIIELPTVKSVVDRATRDYSPIRSMSILFLIFIYSF